MYVDLDLFFRHSRFLLLLREINASRAHKFLTNPMFLILQGCNRRLDPLLSYGAWVRRTAPTGISNDAMGAVPQHPFFLRVIDSLQAYNKNWALPYITVMYSTGPLFLSVIWKEYMLSEPTMADRVRILMPDEYNRHSWSFFTHHQGSSWHGKDARLIFWVRKIKRKRKKMLDPTAHL